MNLVDGAIQAIRNFDPPRPVDCCRAVIDVIRRVAAAVAEFFMNVFRFIFCIEKREHEIPGPDIGIGNGWNRPGPFAWNLPNRWDIDDEIEPVGPAPNDLPVDMEALKAAARNGGHPAISSRMTAADFSALCADYPIHVRIMKNRWQVIREVDVQEVSQIQPLIEAARAEVRAQEGEDAAAHVKEEFNFPQERVRIGRWAEDWAANKTLKIDPESPFFEIFQQAIAFKAQISGGPAASADYRTYSCAREGYLNDSLFNYTMKSLLGFQEMSREPNRVLMRQLDNHRSIYEENPAYKFARRLSKIYVYPTARLDAVYGPGLVPMDVKDKLQIGIGAPMEVFQVAKAHNKVLEYFQEAFNNRNCFDYRITELQQFSFKVTHPHIEDFIPNLAALNTTKQWFIEYHRVFRNEQIFKMSRERGLDFETLKQGRNAAHQTILYERYCTKDNFVQYLQENGQPVKEKQPVPAGQAIPPIIPQQDDWRQALPVGIKKVPLNLIPVAQRVVGAVMGVQDPSSYLATVVKNRQNEYFLEFGGEKAERRHNNHPLILHYQVLWKGKDREPINVIALPLSRRNHADRVRLKDPAIYQVKVHGIEGDTALIDFRGVPVGRPAWEAALPDDEYWTP